MSEISQEKLIQIAAAAEKLVRCKGRYHSEQNYRALAALFGVTTPDLPPLESNVMRERAVPVYQCMDDGKWYDTEKRLYDEVKENGNECRVLYTAPPAQPVAVPDELAARHAYESHVKSQYQYPMLERHPDDAGPWSGEYIESTRQLAWEDWLKSWNACRAAMLAAPGKPSSLREGINALRELGGIDAEKILAERDALNECEIPEGWKLVPIEPTMQQEFAGYKTLNDTGKMSRLMKTRVANIYRAMLAAAPGKEG